MGQIANHRHSVLAVYLTSMVLGATGVIFPASSAILRQRLSLGDTLYGALFLPGLGLAVIASLLGHTYLRRWSLKSLFSLGLFLQAVTYSLMALSGSLGRSQGLPVLIGAMIVSGPAGGAMAITLNTAAIELFPRARSGALSALHGLLGAGASAGPLVVAVFSGLGLWAAAPLLLVVMLLVLAGSTLRRPLVGLTERLPEGHVPSDLPARLRLHCLTALIYGIGEGTLTAWAVVFLKEHRHLQMGVAAGALSGFWLAMTLGRLGGAVVVRRMGSFRLSLLLAAGMAVAFLLIPHCGGPVDSIGRFMFAGLCCSALFPLLLSLASDEFPDRTPQVSAVFSAAVMIGLGIGCFGVGPLRGRIGLPNVYQLSAAGPVVLGMLLLALGRSRWAYAGSTQIGLPGLRERLARRREVRAPGDASIPARRVTVVPGRPR